MFDRMRKVTGALLGAAAVGAQVGNTLICIAALFLGPAVVLGLLAR
jgi:hypothetical protein